MPKTSGKQQIVDFLAKNALYDVEMAEYEDLNEESIGNILDEAIEKILIVLSCRRGYANCVPKSTQWSLNILTVLDDNRFLQMLRVNRTDFDHLVLLVSDDPVFNNFHTPKQFPIPFQLAIVLYRLGSSGEAASLKKIASLFGIGDGGTIDKITRRVFKAFLNLESRYIFWPDEGERSAIVAATFHELPFCIGYVDGSEIALAETPVVSPVSFFSRTHKYTVKVQVICDYLLRIRHVVVGHPGSHHDAKIFKNCEIYKKNKTISQLTSGLLETQPTLYLLQLSLLTEKILLKWTTQSEHNLIKDTVNIE